jgi:xylitol oxidase
VGHATSIRALGSLGVVTRIELDVEPVCEVRQDVYEHVSWNGFTSNLDAIFASGSSVSAFTDWGEDVRQIWVRHPGTSSVRTWRERTVTRSMGWIHRTARRHVDVPGRGGIGSRTSASASRRAVATTCSPST